MNNPLINILTRTSNRPNGFSVTHQSIKNQTYKNIKHIVSYDNDNDLSYLNEYSDIELVKINKLELINKDNSISPNTGKYSPHNLYFNEMIKYVNDGWVIYLDDDDKFTDDTVIDKIVNAINDSDDDTLIVWQFKLGNNLILPKEISKDIPPVIAGIGGGAIAFNCKYNNDAIWDSWKCSDFRVIDKLFHKIPNIKFIKEVLVLAPIPGSGDRIDIIKESDIYNKEDFMSKSIIIGIASLPERVECLKDTVNSLLPQADKIIVGLNNYTEIPNFLNHPKIEAYLLDNSLGDAAKFYKVDDYKDSYYLACDDDLIYPVNYVQYLITKCNEYKSPVGLHGAIMHHPITSMYSNRSVFQCLENVSNDVLVDYLGTGALCFDTSKISVKISDFKSPNMADIWFGDIMKRKRVKTYVLKHNKNFLTYNQRMITNKIDTIFDEYVRTRNDREQTRIVQKWVRYK
jgi:hypothetical protein